MAAPFRFCARCATPLQSVEDGGATRLRCTAPACGYTIYNNPTPVVAGIVEQEGCVLLVRSVGWSEGMFGLVTGFLEVAEAPEAAIVREVGEELSLPCTVGSLVGLYPFEPMNQLLIVYHVLAEAGEPALSDELIAFRRVPVAKLRPWAFGTGHGVRDWLATRTALVPR